METDFEMKFLKIREQEWRQYFEDIQKFRIFILPMLNKKLGVQIGKKKMSDLRTNGGANQASCSSEEIF